MKEIGFQGFPKPVCNRASLSLFPFFVSKEGKRKLKKDSVREKREVGEGEIVAASDWLLLCFLPLEFQQIPEFELVSLSMLFLATHFLPSFPSLLFALKPLPLSSSDDERTFKTLSHFLSQFLFHLHVSLI